MKPFILFSLLFCSFQLLSQNFSFQNVSVEHPCFSSNNGSISIEVDGGMSPLSFNWSNGTNGVNENYIYNLLADSYSVTVTDNSGTSIDTSIILNDVNVVLIANSEDISCFNLQDGSISAYLLEGVPPFQYYLYQGANNIITSPSITDSTFQFSNIPQGIYQVAVSDFRGCTSLVDGNSISEPSEFIITLGDDINIPLGESVQLTALSNFPTDSLSWSPNHNISCLDCDSPIVSPLADTCYLVEAWNSDDCYASDEICINVNPTSVNEIDNSICKIYPILFNENINIDFNDSKKHTISVFNLNGQILFAAIANDLNIATESFDAGIYFIRIDNSNQSFFKKIIKQ